MDSDAKRQKMMPYIEDAYAKLGYLLKSNGVDDNEILNYLLGVKRDVTTALDYMGREDAVRSGNVKLDRRTRSVTVDGADVHFTPTEFDVLRHFMEKPGQPFSVSEIYRAVWNGEYLGRGDSVLVRMYISRIRKKVGQDVVQTVPGVGYRM